MELAQLQEQNMEMKSTRQHTRYPIALSVVFEPGASLMVQKSHPEEVAGSTNNLSEGGLCLSTDQALRESQIVRIRLPIANGPATMPTLAEVRWVKKRSAGAKTIERRGNRYIAGLRFLF
jgi:hypothetical protein